MRPPCRLAPLAIAAHAELAHAVVMYVAALVSATPWRPTTASEVAGQVGRAAEQLRQPGRRLMAFWLALRVAMVRPSRRLEARATCVGPVGRQALPSHAALEFGGQRGVGLAIRGERGVPLRFARLRGRPPAPRSSSARGRAGGSADIGAASISAAPRGAPCAWPSLFMGAPAPITVLQQISARPVGLASAWMAA